jgi:ABC-2 type transport system permease protein
MSQPATIAWFAAHEFRIASREWIGMLSAGKRGRASAIAIGLAIFLVFMHAIAYVAVREFAQGGLDPDRTTLAIVSSIALWPGA